ncbi:23S rRNA (cytidine2498-2'-O)-methyltransferase [Fontibacillus panacisegetis]|uniref:23S rRNA (Cytidine2498-2'-O)-methyltransferase n=1 Tax=Fontibacillus panacisegetis TaxID=670482 RepID=A0A1G7GLY0_9BACL|nr:SAM-dependent methyltransferase [Fontibacillus panacisegetis]SDE89132.1 23S rRNA (cytidine2498-2'-O)-methyltransferase [Fontibacillus panacisegetis]
MNHHNTQENELNVISTKYVCTANHGFAPYAQEELRRSFGSVKSTILVPGEVFVATLLDSEEHVIEKLESSSPMFLRHMFKISWEWSSNESTDWKSGLIQYLLDNSKLNGSKVSIQTRKTEHSLWEGSSSELKDAIQNELSGLEANFVVRDADWIISIMAAKDTIFAGVTSPEQNLSDWNGGAIRFQREEGQISRAKFKLLEAEQVFGIDFTSFHEALDIGAAPGGWTSFLLERGLKVTAVDPAKIHPSLLRSPNLTYVQKNANSVKFRDNQFDLLVCDMSWSPKLTAKLVTDLLFSLVPGGTAVVTVKLLSKKPMALIQDVIHTFQDSRMQIQRAKQLFHNRDEITIYMIKY